MASILTHEYMNMKSLPKVESVVAVSVPELPGELPAGLPGPQPTGEWWLDPATIPRDIIRVPGGDQWVQTKGPYVWRYVEQSRFVVGRFVPLVDDLRGGPWERRDDVGLFSQFVNQFMVATDRTVPFQRVRRSEAEREFSEHFDGKPALMSLLRQRLQWPEPPSKLDGDLLEVTSCWVSPYLARVHHINPEEYLIEHIKGNWGLRGRYEDTTIGEFTRRCPALAPWDERNKLSLEQGYGMVWSTFGQSVPGKGKIEIHIATLLADGLSQPTAIGYP
jgi:hypothetical protein